MTQPIVHDPKICLYCGEAREPIVTPDSRITAIARLGLTPVGVPKWLVLRCPRCGHVDFFWNPPS